MFIGCRQLLHWTNPLRKIGQSKNCCPFGFYDKPILSTDEYYPFAGFKKDDKAIVSRELDLNTQFIVSSNLT